MRRLALLSLFALSCATASGLSPAAAPAPFPPPPPGPSRAWRQARPIVLRHATVMPVSGPEIQDGAVAFADGKLVAVGRNAEVPPPPGAEEFDATGLFVTPGIIDVHSHLGVYASPSSFSNDDGNEATAPVTAEVSAEHSFWPQDPNLRRAAAGGVTSMLVLPGSANLIGGRGFPMKLHFGRTASEVRFPGARDALKMACGENPRRTYGERKMAPSTRMGNAAGYRQAFAQAREYMAKWDAWRRKLEKDPKSADPAPLRDLKLETLAEVLRGNILVQNHCYRADEMSVLLGIADEYGFSIRAFHHALEGYKLRDRLARQQVAIATWADWWGYKLEAWDGIPENAGLMTQAGGRAVIHSDSPFGIQRLNQEAAKAMWRARDSGIPISEQEALRWVTLNAAWVMGVEDRTGSLEPGKMADVVVWKGHPLSVYARASRVYVDGVLTYDAATGPSDISDFELGEHATGAARLTAQPAPHPAPRDAGLAAPCDASQDPGCARPLEVGTEVCVAIQNVTLLTEGQLQPASAVLLQGGKIAQVQHPGTWHTPPAGCRVVDGSGRLLTPGLVDPLTGLGLAEVVQEDVANDLGPRGDASKEPIHAAVRAADSVNPASEVFPVTRLGGITTVGSVPAGGLVPGQSALVATDGTLRRTPLAMHVNLGLAGRDAVSSTRGQALAQLRELLFDARAYAQHKGDFEQNRMRKVSASRLDLEELQPVLAGTLPVVTTANQVSDIRAALALAHEYKLKLIIAGGAEAWQVAPELAAAHVPVILRPTANLPFTFESLNSRLDNAAILSAAGVKVLLTTNAEPYLIRTLAQEAGNAVAWGLPYPEALRALTSNVADAFGLEGGRIAPGAPADLVLWNGDPLELSSRPLAMWLAGRQVPLVSRQQALFQKYRILPK